MKKLFQLLVVFALVVAVIGVAKNSSVWASAPAGVDSSGANSPLPTRIIITGSGSYNVGGICTLDIVFKGSAQQVRADAEVPLAESQRVPFSGQGELFSPGCRLEHVSQDKVIRELASADGSAKICFGANPETKMKIYYYVDKLFTTSPVWAEVASTLEENEGLICASAPYSGVYRVAGRIEPQPNSVISGIPFPIPVSVPGYNRGSVRLPPSVFNSTTITKSGTYAAGGICMLDVLYRIDGLSDTLQVQPIEQNTLTVPFPENQGLLYLPGCHVIHYKDSRIKDTMTQPDGAWKICFAARPGKEMTIYYYTDDGHGDLGNLWKPLATTTENGLACTSGAGFTAVYTPAGK